MADERDGLLETKPSRVSEPLEPRLHCAGDIIGRRWQLEQFLDGGGMGSVWRATDLRLDEPAAVKLLNPHLVRTPEARERFLREARAAARLRGSNVVSVLDFDIDETSKSPYMAMELLRGEDLAARLGRGEPIGYLQTRAILRDVCRAISRAHRAGIIHRDLKPGNIFLASTEEGIVAKVLDFGIAKLKSEEGKLRSLTETGRALGTPHYMSPEQISDAKEVDHRSDIWAIAVIAYECLVGQLAFPGDAAVKVIRKICMESPIPASAIGDVPKGFDEWFSRATRQDPNERFGTVEELLQAFLSLAPHQEASPVPTPHVPMTRSRPPRGRVWVSDANQVDIETIDEVVFRNPVVEEFIGDDRRHFVSGAKGCGKTLLLTYKRSRLNARYRDETRTSKVTFIPEGRPFLDLMSDLRTVGKSAVEYMAGLGNAKRLWGFALRMSILSYDPSARLPPSVLSSLPPRLRAVAEGQKAEPTIVAKEVLALTVSQVHQVLDQAEMALEHALRSVHQGVFVFVDKIDQALRGVSREAWIAMQAGLVEAAWDLMNTNAHIKVFATIREEAFSAYESDIKTNLFGATTRIRYSKRDLLDMLERLTAFYEGLPLRDFVTLDVVSAGGSAQSESAFDFIHRHTLGRPRDFVIVASEISRRRGELDERTFKSIVRETCAGILVANVFDEMRVFLEVLGERERRMRLLSSIPFGVLSRDDLVDIWCQFNGVDREYFESYTRGTDDVFHPFRELYDCGLLGVVSSGADSASKIQQFKQPHHPMDAYRYDLPRSEVYLLHPSLHALMRRLGIQDNYHGMRNILVGQDLPWRIYDGLAVSIQRELLRVAKGDERGVGRPVRELLEELDYRLRQGEALQNVSSEIAQRSDFRTLCAELERLEWDDLHLALLNAFGSAEVPRR